MPSNLPPYDDERAQAWSEAGDTEPFHEYGIRTRQLESLARDIEKFDPDDKNSNIDDYLREVERCLLDLPNPSTREKLKLIWKTTSKTVHNHIESLLPGIRDDYAKL